MVKLTLKFKILFCTISIIFTIGSVVAYIVYAESRDMMMAIKRDAIHKADIELARTTTHHFEDAALLVKGISTREAIVQYFASGEAKQTGNVTSLLDTYAQEHPEYLAIYLLDEKGVCRASTDRRFVGEDYSFRQYFKQAARGESYAEVALGKTSNQLGYYFSYPVIQANRTRGVVVAKLNPEYIEKVFRGSELAKEGSLMLVNKDGVVLYAQKSERTLHSLGPLNEQERESIRLERKFMDHDIQPLQYGKVHDILRNYQEPTSVDIQDPVDKELEIIGVTKIAPFPFYIVNEVEVDHLITASVRLASILGLGVFAAAMLAMIAITVFVHNFLNPLGKITAFTRKISEGDFGQVIQIKTNDEFQILASALNSMSVKLEDLYNNLEEKIREQTKKLTSKVSELEEAHQRTTQLLSEVKNEKKLSERQAHDLQKYQLAVENVSDHIVITDADGYILYANKAVERITGFARDEILGTKAGVKWGKLMSGGLYQQLWEDIKTHKKTFEGEFTNRRKNGERYIAEAKVSPILDDTGRVIFFVGIERDVTKLREVDRMKTEFISLASHQLRTPLAAMKWFLEMLLVGDSGPITPEQREMIVNINDSNERMIGLVNALLNVSRIESGKIVIDPRPTDLSKLIHGLLTELDRQCAEKKQTCTVHLPPDLPMINIDQKLIRQVYMNLLTNAIKYSPPGTEIGITISIDGDFVVSQIKDNGYGIPVADKDKIFQKFFRADNVTRQDSDGNGLGLYLVRSIVESSGGKVWFESEEDKGTTFYFTLPMNLTSTG